MTMHHLHIFLSSPGDVSRERQLAREVIDRIQSEGAYRDRIKLEVVAWDKPGAGSPMPAHMEPQEAIYQGLKKPSECDIVIVIFWARMGTPLSEKYLKPDASRYRSGTEYEYLEALGAAQKFGKPDVLVYRRKKPPAVDLDDLKRDEKISQWALVESFFSEFRNSDGSFKSFYKEYDEPADFKDSLDQDLRELITKYLAILPIEKAEVAAPTQEAFWDVPLSFVEIQIPKPSHGPEPPLELTRIPESARTQLNYRTGAIPFVGRVTELNQLNCFLNNASSFLWWLVTGKAGSGKSRLAFELCIQIEQDWRVGFLPSDHGFQHWRDWMPTRPTLVVVNYAQSRAKETHAIIESLYDRKESLSNPVRLLLLERSSSSWANDLYGAGSGKLKVEDSQYDQPLELNPLSQEQQWELLSEILQKCGAKELPNRERTLEELCRVDPHNRPLFAALAAHSISHGLDIGLMGGEELVADYLRREHGLFWVPAGVTEQDKSLLALVTMLNKTIGSKEAGPSLKQTLREISRSQAQEYLPKFAPGSAQQDIVRYNVMVGIDAPGQLRPLKPDLIGEYFVLEHLSPTVDPLSLRAQSLCVEAWRLDCISFADFIRKAAKDFPNHPSVEILDRRWGNDLKSWFVWSVGMIFRQWDLAKQGKFDRILREFREILKDAPRPEDRELDPLLSFDLVVPDLIKLFGKADRLADAEQVYEEYSLFLRDAGLENQEESLLSTVEYDLITFGCLAEDPSLFERLWPRLLKRAQESCDLDVIADAAWAGYNFVGCFAKKNKESGLMVFGDVSKLLTAKQGVVSDEPGFRTERKGFREVPLRCAHPLIASCWKDKDFDSCIRTFVEAVRFIPATPEEEKIAEEEREEAASMPPLVDVLLDLSKVGQALAEHLVEGKKPQEAAHVFDSLWQLIARVSDTEAAITETSLACWKAMDVAVEVADIDLALRIHSQLFQASKNRPDDLFLREAAMGSRVSIVVACTGHGRLDTALTLYEELRIMLHDSVSSGKESDRNKILYACFCVAYCQQQAGFCYEANETVTRALSTMPLSESLAYLRETFGHEQVDSLLKQLGYAQSN